MTPILFHMSADIPEVLKSKPFFSQAIKKITNERLWLHYQKKWDLEHNRQFQDGELAEVAIYYACPPQYTPYLLQGDGTKKEYPIDTFSPVPFLQDRESVITRLIVAGSLIAAEIDRLIETSDQNFI